MATIDIRRSHTLDKDEAKRRAEELANGMQEKLGIRWHWDGEQIRFDAPSGAAKGATGTVSVNPTEVRVEVDLPLPAPGDQGHHRGQDQPETRRFAGQGLTTAALQQPSSSPPAALWQH